MATLHRFFVDRPLRGGTIELPEPAARQVATVLRLRPGDPIVLFDGSGGEWSAHLQRVGREAATAALDEHREPDREPALRLTLAQALLKGDRFEWTLQKGTELGVATFRPVVTRRTVAGGGARADRWRRIVVEAAEQCGRCLVPEVAPPQALEEALAARGPAVLLWEGESRRSLEDALREALAAAPGEGVRLFVGPEGGFDPQEAERAAAAGAFTATLGPRVLRSETAALAAVALTLLTGKA